eukprot:257349_1
MSTSSKIKQISELYGIGIPQLNERLESLQFVVEREGEAQLLEYLLKSDLNAERAADLYFNEQKENEYDMTPIEKFPSPSASPSTDLHFVHQSNVNNNKENTAPMRRRRKRKRNEKQQSVKKRKLNPNTIISDTYDEDKATSMILSILKESPSGIRRYQLLVQLQRHNEGIKWSDSFQENVGEFNDFVKRHDLLKIYDINNQLGIYSRNFGIMTSEKYLTIMRYRHNLYESD